MNARDFLASMTALGFRIRNDGGTLLVTGGKLSEAQRQQIREWKPALLGILPRVAFKDDDGSFWVHEVCEGQRSIVHEDYANQLFTVYGERPWQHPLLKATRPVRPIPLMRLSQTPSITLLPGLKNGTPASQ